jgi:hypothetical protein
MLLYAGTLVVLVALWLVALLDAIRIPRRVWDDAGRSKTAWVAVLLFGVLGASLVYLVLATRCESCGFTSNSVGAVNCRSCGAGLQRGR